MLGIGLQHKTVDCLTSELELTSSQILGLFNRIIRRLTKYLYEILGKAIEETFSVSDVPEMRPLNESINEDLEKTEKVM